MHFKDSAPGFHVRPAFPAELGMAFALLPQVSNQGVLADTVFVAEMAGITGIIGAGAFSVLPFETIHPGVRGDLFVLPSFRRQGVGQALLREMKKSLRDWGVDYLHAWNPVALGAEPEFLPRSGFHVVKKVFRFEVDTGTAYAALRARLARLQSRKRIPSGAALLPLASVDRTEVVKLYAEYFGCLEQQARSYFETTLAQQTNAEISFGLMLDGQLIGFILWKRDADGVPAVELWITKPSFHTGWPAIALLGASIERGAQLGYAKGRFECDENTVATLHMARLLNARALNTMVRYAVEA